MKTALVSKVPFALLAACAAVLAFAAPASAQEPGSVAVNLTARKVVEVDKKETFQPADKARPGEVLQYDATCKNTLPRGVKDVKPVVPVPTGSVYVDGSAKPANFEASLDGKTFAKPPLTREVKTADGTVKKETVPADQYRALRWTLPDLAAGAESTVSARVRLGTNAGK